MRFDIREFNPGDFYAIEGREGRANEATDWWMVEMYSRKSVYYARGERCPSGFTCLESDRVIGCAGMMIFARLGQLWLHATDELFAAPLWFHRNCLEILARVKLESGVHRIETSIDASKRKNCAWIVALGLKAESQMPKYGPNGETFTRFAWVSEG
jgi:hypothetical protein